MLYKNIILQRGVYKSRIEMFYSSCVKVTANTEQLSKTTRGHQEEELLPCVMADWDPNKLN